MLYVAYGSNMNLKQMAFRCPSSKVIGVGKLKGWKLVFNVHADIIKADATNEVPVLVWDIADEDWDMLDRYEGYPSYYVKENVMVELDNGETVEAVVYVMNDKRKGISPPYENYFDCIMIGYMENGIDTDYLYEVLAHSWDNETEYNQYNTKEEVI